MAGKESCRLILSWPKQRIAQLLVLLLTGSINDIERVQADLPTSLLDKVKRKIQLFDGYDTSSIYEEPKNNIVRIKDCRGLAKQSCCFTRFQT